MRALVATLLTLCVLLPGLASAGPASTDHAFDHDVLDVVVSGNGAALGIAMKDDGSVTNLNADQDTWFLMKVTPGGLDVVQRGDVDPAVCDSNVQVEDTCDSDARHIAISADGSRLAVAGPVDASSSVIVLVDAGGVVRRDTLQGVVSDVVMSDNGKVVFVATDRSIGGGTLYRYAWGAAVSRWDQTLNGDPGPMAIAPGGAVAYVGDGGTLRAYTQRDSSSNDDPNFPGSPVSVAASATSDGITIAGGSGGDLRIYDATSIAANRAQLNILSSRGALRDVGISSDATRIMAAWADGTVHVYELKHDPILLGSRIFTQSVPGATDVQLSRDGETLLIVTADKIRMVDVQTATTLWTDAIANAKADMADNGGRVAAVNGDTLRYYDPVSDIELVVPHPGELLPGDAMVLNFTVSNAGNRVEDITLDVDGPAWAQSISATSMRLLPGGTETVSLSIAVPPQTPAGQHDITIVAQGASTSSTVIETQVASVARFLVNTTGARSLAVDAGSAAVFTFPAVNIGNLAGAPPISLDVPTQGWSARVLGGGGSAAPGAEFDIKIALEAPANAAELAVGELNANIAGEALNLSATVGARFGVSWAGPGTVTIAPGNQTIFQLTVTNLGNAPDGFLLSLGAVPHAWNFAFDDGNTIRTVSDVAPGASKKVLLTLQAPVGASGPAVGLLLQAESLADPEKRASHTVLAQIDAPVIDAPTGEGEVPGEDSPAPFVAPLLLAGALWRRRRMARSGP